MPALSRSLGGSQHQAAVFGLQPSNTFSLPTVSGRAHTSQSSNSAMGTRMLAPLAASTFHPYEKKMQQAVGLDPVEIEAMGEHSLSLQVHV